MNMQPDIFYTKRLEELKTLERNADVTGMTFFTDICRNTHGFNHQYAVYQNGEQFYIRTPEGIFEMQLCNKSFVDNEINLHKHSWRFEFTPDNIHIWSVELFKNDLYDWHISDIEARQLPASVNYIHGGDTAIYNGVSLTFDAENQITISKADKTFSMKVKEDDDKVYGFLKRTVKARYGAYGLYSFMENIAEQAKINPIPFWSSAFMIMDKYVA